MDLRAGPEPAGPQRQVLAGGKHAAHVAGHATEQVLRVLRGPDTCSDCGEFARRRFDARSPEAGGRSYSHPNNLGQVAWNSPVTNRLLLEAGFTLHQLRWSVIRVHPDFPDTRNLIRVTGTGRRNSRSHVPGLGGDPEPWIGNHVWKASRQLHHGRALDEVRAGRRLLGHEPGDDTNQQITYRLQQRRAQPAHDAGVPDRVLDQFHEPRVVRAGPVGLRRLTLGAGIRYDHFRSNFPAFSLGPSTVPADGVDVSG